MESPMHNGHHKTSGLVSDTVGSWVLALPRFLVPLGGVAVGLTLFLLCAKGDTYKDLPWWMVFLPSIIALGVFFLAFTVATLAWIFLAVLVMTGNAEVVGEYVFRLDVLLGTAKACVLGYGKVQLLMLSLGLLLLKLSIWPKLPFVYPLLPLIVLGSVYIFLAVLLKPPEVDSMWYSFAGISLLSQSIMLTIKADYFYDSKRLSWAATFAPAWLTYVLLLVYCVVSPIQVSYEDEADVHHRTAGSAESPFMYGSIETPRTQSRNLQSQLQKVGGIGAWVIGWGLSQVFLTLRLDGLYKASWLGVLLPAILGWIFLVICVSDLVVAYFTGVLKVLVDALRVVCVPEREEYEEPDSESPLFSTRTPLSSTRY